MRSRVPPRCTVSPRHCVFDTRQALQGLVQDDIRQARGSQSSNCWILRKPPRETKARSQEGTFDTDQPVGRRSFGPLFAHSALLLKLQRCFAFAETLTLILGCGEGGEFFGGVDLS